MRISAATSPCEWAERSSVEVARTGRDHVNHCRIPAVVSSDWLAAHFDDPSLRVIDCSVRFEAPLGVHSGRPDFHESHIPGAIFADHFELADASSPLPMMMPSADVLARSLGSVGLGDGMTAVIYDRTDGMWAARLWWMLRAIGFDDAAVLDGGLKAWIADGRSVTDEARPADAALLTPRPRPDAFVDARAVLDAIAAGNVAIVSALDDSIHRSAVYGRPGRIPTSRSVPFSSLLDPETGKFTDVDAIRQRFQTELESSRVITYCGGGVAASLAALALHVAGHKDVAVYDGSLLEWCADPGLPLEP
jgi:thiosulfate/3-mercaptopyruvate sulfurtransferase